MFREKSEISGARDGYGINLFKKNIKNIVKLIKDEGGMMLEMDLLKKNIPHVGTLRNNRRELLM